MDLHASSSRFSSRLRSPIAALAIVAFALVLAACGDSDSGGDGSGGGSGSKPRVVQIPAGQTEFTQTVRTAAAKEAEKLGVDYEVQVPAKPDVGGQTETLNAVIASKPDVILLEPIDGKGMMPPIQQAKQAGIKVITYDSNVEDAGLPDAFLSTDYVEGGKVIARELLDMTGDKGTMLHLAAIPGLNFTENLLKGYKDVMSATPGVTQLPVAYTTGEPSKAASIVSAALSRDPDLAGAFIGTLPEQKGALNALRSADALHKVKTVAWDANPATIQTLTDGDIDVVVSVPAGEYGKRLISMAKDLADGKKVQTPVQLGTCVITKDNVDSDDVKPCMYESIN
jgi:ribose transport system substrate-binding protein